jgi:RNA polymerase sigma factor for flagellar operon FliA
VGSLQAETDDVGERDAYDSIADSEEENPYDQALRAERKQLLERAIGELPPREREVLTLYDFQELTMKQVGERLRIGESRVSQIHTSALLRLRTRLAKMQPNGAMQASRSARPFASGASA